MNIEGLWEPPVDAVEKISTGLQAKLDNTDRKNLIEYHNVYVEYTLALMLFGTGHRPVEDPFCYRYQLDESAGLALVDDKATNESRRYRLAYLPDIAREQISHYINHLKNLIIFLRPRTQSELRLELEKMLAYRQSQKLPLFFFIRNERVEGVSNTDISEMFYRYTPVPSNIHRKWIATTLVNQGAPSWLAACCLGHMESRVLPNGNFCHESHGDIRQHINKFLNHALVAEGWRPRVSSFRPQFSQEQCLPRFVNLNRELGSVSRFKRREVKRNRVKVLIRELLSEVDLELEKKEHLQVAQIEDIYNRLADRLRTNSLPVKYSLALFTRYSAQYLKNNSRMTTFLSGRIERLEATQWKRSDVYDYNQAVRVRKNLISYMEEIAKDQCQVGLYQKNAIRVFCFALFSLETSDKSLMKVLDGSCVLVEMKCVMGLQVGVKEPTVGSPFLFIDPVTAALSKRISEQDSLDSSLAKKELLVVSKGLGFQNKNVKLTILTLSKIAKTLSRFESSGPVSAASSGALQYTPFDLKVYARLIYGRALLEFHQTPELLSGYEPSLTSSVKTKRMTSLSEFNHDLRNILTVEAIDKYASTQKKKQKFRNGKLSVRQKKAYLATCLNGILVSKELPILLQLISCWGIWLCQNKTRHNNDIQSQTVVDYMCVVVNKMHQFMSEGVLYFDPDEWQQCYLQVVEGSTIGAMKNLAARLYDFHDYLVRNWRAPAIDWSDIFALAGSKNTSGKVDANLITPKEYQLALSFLLEQGEIRREYQFCAWILFIGYRFGLRWSESYALLESDIIFRAPSSLYINVQANSERRLKSASARRMVPLMENISLEEQQLVGTMLSRPETMGVNQSNGGEFLCIDPYLKEKYDETLVSRIINALLKRVSGDRRVHFHHLRHAYACRLMLLNGPWGKHNCKESGLFNLLRPTQTNAACWQEPAAPLGVTGLRGISDLLGHSEMGTSVHSYLHILDWMSLVDTQCYMPALSDRLLGLLLGRKEAAIRKKRHRLAVPREAHHLLSWLKEEIVHPQAPPVLLVETLEISIDDLYLPVSKDLSYVVVHSLLANYAVHGRDVSITSQRMSLSQNIVNAVVDLAAQAEKVSGYERFAISDAIAEPQAEEFRNVVEWNNVDNALKKIIAVDKPDALQEALQAWCRSYHSSTSEYFFDDDYDLFAFVSILIDVGVVLDRAFYQSKGQAIKDPSVRGRLNKLGLSELGFKSKYQSLEKGTQNRKQHIILNIRKLSGTLTSKKQINRLMFVLCSGARVS